METIWIVIPLAFVILLASILPGIITSVVTRKKSRQVQPLLGVVMPNKEEDKNA